MRMNWFAVVCVGLLGCQEKGGQDLVLQDQKARVSYSIGMNMGEQSQTAIHRSG